MIYLHEKMKKNDNKETTLTKASKLGARIAFCLALQDSLTSIEKARKDTITTEADIKMLEEMIIQTIQISHLVVGEA